MCRMTCPPIVFNITCKRVKIRNQWPVLKTFGNTERIHPILFPAYIFRAHWMRQSPNSCPHSVSRLLRPFSGLFSQAENRVVVPIVNSFSFSPCSLSRCSLLVPRLILFRVFLAPSLRNWCLSRCFAYFFSVIATSPGHAIHLLCLKQLLWIK